MVSSLKNAYHFLLAWFGNIIYRSPSRQIFVLGVTGTKGKSTTLELINAILEAAGKKTAISSSLRFKIDKESTKNTTGMTMPGRFSIQHQLRQAVAAGCQYFLLETTSQGVVQHRHRFIDFDAVMVTNLSPEHIESHGSFEKYRAAKTSFFEYVSRHSVKSPKWFFINNRDESKNYFTACLPIGMGAVESGDNQKIIYFDRNNLPPTSDWLNNDFNLQNAAAAMAFAESQSISRDVVEKILQSFNGIPGRLEYVQKEPFAVVVDYAHTPDSLAKIYGFLAKENSKFEIRNSKLICVLGAAGGGRDKWKRPAMGKIAAQYCQEIILTDEDSYDEDLKKILAEIRSGIETTSFPKDHIFEIFDRREAIRKAISLARPGDTIVCTGKGSEASIHLANGKMVPWGERGVIEEELKRVTPAQ